MSKTPNSGKSDWLLLTDYASKYRISVSTLRRRIKNGSQAYRFEEGRYFLPDLPSSLSGIEIETKNKNENEPVPQVSNSLNTSSAAPVLPSIPTKDEPLITTTSKLLNELKQAYTLILHEKEEQIVYLKEEIADLKTLVRVLESENARLLEERERFAKEIQARASTGSSYGNA